MIRATKVFVRPSTDVPWYQANAVFNDYIKTTFVDTGKRVSKTSELSVDGLTMTLITEWVDQAAYDEYNKDTVCNQMFIDRKKYFTATGITTNPATIETI